MEHDRALQKREDNGISIWQVFSGIALIVSGILLIISLPDIKRYIKISRM